MTRAGIPASALPLSPPHHARTAGKSPAHYAQLMQQRKATVRELPVHAAVQAERKAKLGAGRHIGPGG